MTNRPPRHLPIAARLAALLALLPPAAIRAQQSAPTSPTLQLSLTGAWMMTNNMSYKSFNRPAFGIEAALLRPVAGNDYWMHRRRFPTYGLKASYAHIPDGIAGHRLGLEALLEAPLARRLSYTLGLGLSLYTRPTSITHDPDNIFIGSAINCLIDIGLTYRLTPTLGLSASLLHTSNGRLYRPNQGLNYPQFALRYSPRPTAAAPAGRPACTPIAFCRNEWGITLSPAVALSHNISQSGYYFGYDVSLHALHYLDPVVAVGGSLDLWYNFSHPQQYIWYNDPYPIPLYISALAMVEGFWGPLSIRAGIGPHLLVSGRTKIPIFERVGAYLNLGRQVVGVALHANAGQIEFIEWSYGLRFGIGSGSLPPSAARSHACGTEASL